MRPIVLATCREYPDLHPDDHRLRQALRARGVDVRVALWDAIEPDGSPEAPAVLLRSTWDYYDRIEAFRAWVARCGNAGMRLMNPPEVVLANLDKRYLRDLARAGVPILPTAWVEGARTTAQLVDVAGSLAWNDVVVKPAVGAGASRTTRTTRTALQRDPAPLAAALACGAAMVQPFATEIAATGEWSLLYFGGAFSHAVLKTPAAGDYRVQWRHGGGHRQAEMPPGMREQGDRIVARLPEACAYARVDGVWRDGQLVLMELELTEPYLFLAEHEPAAERLAAALVGALA
jgi:hypothetical protein